MVMPVTAMLINGPPARGRIELPYSHDYGLFSFSVSEGAEYDIYMNLKTLAKGSLTLFGPNNDQLYAHYGDGFSGSWSPLITTYLQPGEYYLEARGLSRATGDYSVGVLDAQGSRRLPLYRYRPQAFDGPPALAKISEPGEENWFEFTVETPMDSYLCVTTNLVSIDSTRIYLFGPNTRDAYINETQAFWPNNLLNGSLSPGTYYLKVTGGSPTDSGFYTIKSGECDI
jgi:hypothetical protein